MLFFYLLSSFEFLEPGGVASPMLAATAFVSPPNGVFTNPAMLGEIDSYNLSFFRTNPYNLSEITFNQVGLNLKWPMNLGLGVSGLGTLGYQELIFSLGGAFRLRPGLSYGVSLQGLYLSIAGYGTDFIPALDLGVLFSREKYSLGLIVDNINQPRNSGGDALPAKLGVGMVLRPVEDLKLGVDFIRGRGYGERLLTGVEFRPKPIFSLRFGLGSNPFIVGAGLGVGLGFLTVDYAYRFHPRLKDTHIIGLGISLK